MEKYIEVSNLANIEPEGYKMLGWSTDEAIYEVKFKANFVYELGIDNMPTTLYLIINAKTKEYEISAVSKIYCYENGLDWTEEAAFIDLEQKNKVIVLEKLLHGIQQAKDRMLRLLSTDEYTNMLHNIYVYNHAGKAYNDYIIGKLVSEYDMSII